jgi:FkbM family methyltransferase
MNNLIGALNLLPLAVFSRTGTMSMEPSQPGLSPGHAFAREVWTSDAGDRFDASCTTLDDFARVHPWPALIKIDVEGCEAEVIRGAEWLMREARPAILCEVHDDALAREAETIVRSRGYRATWLTDDGYHVRWLYATADQERA